MVHQLDESNIQDPSLQLDPPLRDLPSYGRKVLR